MKLDEIAPWGRSYSEYVAMFNLGEEELSGRIVGCGDGPAAFNADATARGKNVTSVDPIYLFEADAIRARIAAVRPTIEQGLRDGAANYVWKQFRTVDELIETRLSAMDRFLQDYENGRHSGRYLAASLPTLPFEDRRFDLALVSHFLFTYSDHMNEATHLQAVNELMRASNEVRVFPLVDLSGAPSPHLRAVTDLASANGWSAKIERVNYEFQRGANKMLKLVAG